MYAIEVIGELPDEILNYIENNAADAAAAIAGKNQTVLCITIGKGFVTCVSNSDRILFHFCCYIINILYLIYKLEKFIWV